MSATELLMSMIHLVKLRFMKSTFTGILLNSEGAPVVGATLYFKHHPSTKTVKSGRFTVALKGGDYEVSVRYQGQVFSDVDRILIKGDSSEVGEIKIDLSEHELKTDALDQLGSGPSQQTEPEVTAPKVMETQVPASPLKSKPTHENNPREAVSLSLMEDTTGDHQDLMARWVEALEGYQCHEDRLPSGFLEARVDIYEDMRLAVQGLVAKTGVKVKALKRSKIQRLFGFVHTLKPAESQAAQALMLETADLGLYASPMLWQVDAKGDPVLERLRITEIHGDAARQVAQRRGLFIILSYRLPKRRSTGHDYKDEAFQGSLKAFINELEQLNIAPPCIFNLGQRSHVGLIAQVSSLEALKANPERALLASVESFAALCHQLNETA